MGLIGSLLWALRPPTPVRVPMIWGSGFRGLGFKRLGFGLAWEFEGWGSQVHLRV